ncbi:hypothetical protein SARC_06031 [Sphaeroforma arctica JP610]|uniref:Bicarbonate transporter-like transmembrane domain-containing protein n=1 Tax=Sphaeroforma arctica JP610 TaxID=667725 RepID=A0A0L0FXV4_9EUKA|nr:hypothetical protein SARC_06031 [Sphaeroforma arctica JP610]KNC81660.1 hypothetical protein SARC_06031 [Sphaeroforma arctica JP610]|eukprot:XP_014155562.1 hypothetical protein SARC_06031 [Sphaeroforma arctica JP610]
MGKDKRIDVGRFSVSKRPSPEDLDNEDKGYTSPDLATKFVNVEGSSTAALDKDAADDDHVIMMVETSSTEVPLSAGQATSATDSGVDDAFQRTINKYDLQDLGEKIRALQDTPTVPEIVKKIKKGNVQMTQITAAPLLPKDVAEELRAHKDLIMFATVADTTVVMLDITSQTAEGITEHLLRTVVERDELEEDMIPEIMETLLSEVQNEHGPLQQWRRSIQGTGFILALAEVSEMKTRHVVIARLRTPLNLGSWDGSKTKFVGLILAPPGSKRTKNVQETGHTFATLFADHDFMTEATKADRSELLQFAALKFVRSEVSTREQIASHVEENTADEEESDMFRGLRGGGRILGGITGDLKRRWKWYKSDFLDGIHPVDWASVRVYLVGVISLYFACVVPCIAFGALWNSMTAPEICDIDDPTHCQPASNQAPIGVTEVLLSEAICGIIFSIFGGQPLLVLRASGPIAIFGGVIFSWSVTLDIPFLEFYAWVGIWACLYCMIIGVVNMSYFVVFIGRFTEEAFAMLISCIFIAKAITHIVTESTLTVDAADANSHTEDFLLSLTLVVGVWLIAMYFTSFYGSPYLRPVLRYVLYMFGPLLAFVMMTGFSYIPALPHVARLDAEVSADIAIDTTSGRPWWVDFYTLEIKWVMLAALAAVPLTMIVYLEQNVSALLIGSPENRLMKGDAFHWDMVLTGMLLAVSSVLGMPWCHGALPHSVIHPRLLADTEEYEKNGVYHTHVVRSRETRWVNLIAHIFFLFTILAKPLLRILPVDVLYGYFLYLGVASLQTNHLYTRLLLWFMQPENYPPSHYVRRVPIKTIHLFTLCQFVAFLVLWFVHDNFYLGDDLLVPPALFFPVVVFLCIPVRRYLLPVWFEEKYLKILTEDEPEEVHSTLNWVGGAARDSLLPPDNENSEHHRQQHQNARLSLHSQTSTLGGKHEVSYKSGDNSASSSSPMAKRSKDKRKQSNPVELEGISTINR